MTQYGANNNNNNNDNDNDNDNNNFVSLEGIGFTQR